ncbi:MAG: hypothetical protein K2N40_01195, partial [Ureaplasma sp.]|nr:hypothetical protein [Ureaplasma sp.]
MLVKKLKIYLSANFDSKLIQEQIFNFLDKRYNKIIKCNDDNYMINILKICNLIKQEPTNSICYIFINDANNLKFLANQFDTIKISYITKNNKSKMATFLNTNILCFSVTEFSVEEILKIIKYHLCLLN